MPSQATSHPRARDTHRKSDSPTETSPATVPSHFDITSYCCRETWPSDYFPTPCRQQKADHPPRCSNFRQNDRESKTFPTHAPSSGTHTDSQMLYPLLCRQMATSAPESACRPTLPTHQHRKTDFPFRTVSVPNRLHRRWHDKTTRTNPLSGSAQWYDQSAHGSTVL